MNTKTETGNRKGLLNRRSAGFTMIEMLITIAIIGILAAVAYPSYNQSTRKARRSDAAATALTIQVAQEKFRGSCPFYAQSLGSTNTCGSTAALSTVKAPSTSSEGYYSMSITASSATGNAYEIKATATGSQAADTGCTTLTLTFNSTNPTGLKAPTACWAR